MMVFDLKPYPGEDENSFVKRKAYFIRLLSLRFTRSEDGLKKKLKNLKPLSASDREKIDALWARYLTPAQRDKLIDYRYYEVFNKVLRDGERLCDYMPDAFYYAFIDDYFTNPQHSMPCDDKNLYDLYFHDINRPKTLIRKINDMILDEDFNEITMSNAIAIAREHGEVVLKISRFSSQGSGIVFWNSVTDDEILIREFLRDSKDVICQALIKQHSELSRLSPTSVNTVRIISLVFQGKVYVLSSTLRMGMNGSRVDNAGSGGIFSGINPNGQLKEVAYDKSANKYLCHPQGTAFEGVTIPNFNECIDIVTSLAKRFCSVSRLISWDFAIGEDGHPILIEFNLSCGGINSHQLCNGPIFGDLTEDVLKEVFANSYTLNSIIKSFQQ